MLIQIIIGKTTEFVAQTRTIMFYFEILQVQVHQWFSQVLHYCPSVQNYFSICFSNKSSSYGSFGEAVFLQIRRVCHYNVELCPQGQWDRQGVAVVV